jgi:hypothetical protein
LADFLLGDIHETLENCPFFLGGILASLLLAGCFDPITAAPPKTGDPFTVGIMIGKDGSARTVAGPDSDRI